MKPLPSSLWLFYGRYLYKYKISLFSLTFLATLVAIVDASNPYILKIMIDRISSWESETRSATEAIALPITLYFTLNIFKEIVERSIEVYQSRTIPLIQSKMRKKLFKNLQRHSQKFFQENLVGTISSKILNITTTFEQMLSVWQNQVFFVTLYVIFTAVLMLNTSMIFSAILVLWYCLFIAISVRFSMSNIVSSQTYAQASSTVAGKIVDSLVNVAAVQVFSRRRYEIDYLRPYQAFELEAQEVLSKKMAKVNFFQGLASTVLLALFIYLLALGWEKRRIEPGDFVFVISSSLTIIRYSLITARRITKLYENLGTAQDAWNILSLPLEIVDIPNAKDIFIDKGSIDFENVDFEYSSGNLIFKSLSVHIEGGQKIGLVGASGSGKSSFIQLILRLFDIKGGMITIDGQNIAQVTQDSLRAQIAIIPQDPSLFHRTILENVRYAKPEASDAEVIEACKKACCHEFIVDQPLGYMTEVGERGAKLSGGQRQRIAIARAILKNAPILILDEATSALDSITESYIQESLLRVMQGRTVLVIAHRLSTLAGMDRILVFDKGVIIEDGTHIDLLAKGRYYTKLWSIQKHSHVNTMI